MESITNVSVVSFEIFKLILLSLFSLTQWSKRISDLDVSRLVLSEAHTVVLLQNNGHGCRGTIQVSHC